MNDWGIDLKGKHGVMKAAIFYQPKADTKARTFVIEGGPGCDPTVGTHRKVTGHWAVDGMRDSLNSYDFEYILIDGKKVSPKVTGDPPPEKVVVVSEVPELQKKVRRKAS